MAQLEFKVPDVGRGGGRRRRSCQVARLQRRRRGGPSTQAVAEVMTDKATVEVPSPVDGVVAELGGAGVLGDVLLVGSPLVRSSSRQCVGIARWRSAVVAVDQVSAAPKQPRRPAIDQINADADADADADETDAGDDRGEDGQASGQLRLLPVSRPHRARPVHPWQATNRGPLQRHPLRRPGATLRATVPHARRQGAGRPGCAEHAHDKGVDLRRVGASGPAGRVTVWTSTPIYAGAVPTRDSPPAALLPAPPSLGRPGPG